MFSKVKYSRKLISADHSANIGEFKHNFIVELVPLCKVRMYVHFNVYRQSTAILSITVQYNT